MSTVQMLATLIPWLIIGALTIIPSWRILRKAGFMPALSLVLVVPLLGWLCVLALLAFVRWPTLRRRLHTDIASTFE